MKAFPDKKLANHTPVDIASYFSELDRKNTSPTPKSTTPLDQVRKDHHKLITALNSKIRRRNYSIRTEQSYKLWVVKFIGFSGNRSPKGSEATDIIRYLE
ncbi:MAG: hypothetical protein GXP08_03670 [Gammaproteobacteria bacterium]|nr:hypothetical protein [Gammaproteobacteria bacterium]